MLNAEQIVRRLGEQGPRWVTLSGGNPAMLKLDDLIVRLHFAGYKIAVETQGSLWKEWLNNVDMLTVSPKPPSSGMAGKTANQFDAFMRQVRPQAPRCLKIVVFDVTDYDWARAMIHRYPDWPAFLSCGTDSIGGELLVSTSKRYRWLCGLAARDLAMRDVRVLPQLHVIAWGHRLGV
jgi:7-carboxy-7-deazaguanine synthase